MGLCYRPRTRLASSPWQDIPTLHPWTECRGGVYPGGSPARIFLPFNIPWSFFFMAMKDGGLRPCMVYWALNTIPINFHCPCCLGTGTQHSCLYQAQVSVLQSSFHLSHATSEGTILQRIAPHPPQPQQAFHCWSWCLCDWGRSDALAATHPGGKELQHHLGRVEAQYL